MLRTFYQIIHFLLCPDLDFSYNDNYVPNGDPFGDFNPNPVSKENNTSSLENDSTSLADKLGSTINLNNNSYDHSTPINSDSSPSSPASTSFTQHNSLGLVITNINNIDQNVAVCLV